MTVDVGSKVGVDPVVDWMTLWMVRRCYYFSQRTLGAVPDAQLQHVG